MEMELTGPPWYLKLMMGGLYLAPKSNAGVLVGPADALGTDFALNGCSDRANPLPSCISSTTIKVVVDVHLNRLAVGKSCSESLTIALRYELYYQHVSSTHKVKESDPMSHENNHRQLDIVAKIK